MSRKQIAASLGQVPAGPPPGMDYQAQLQQIARQRAIAQQLGQAPERINQAGGYVVPYSAGEGLARLGQAFVSKKMNDKLDTKEAMARKGYETGRSAAVTQLSADPTNPQAIVSARDFGLNPGDFNPAPIKVGAGGALVDPRTNKAVFNNPADPRGGNQRYGSPQIMADGRLMVLDRSTGQLVDTGQKGSANKRLITLPDGSVQEIDMRAPVAAPGQAPTTAPVVSPDEALRGRAAAAKATELGKAAGENTAGLPDALADIQKMRQNIAGLRQAPGFAQIYGLQGTIDPRNYIPGTEASDARARLGNIDAQAFGIAIQKMRGLGSLSNAEGSRVTNAFTRAVNQKQSPKAAAEAWDEVNTYLDLAEARAQQKAGGNFTGSAQGVPKITGDADYAALPSGTTFIDPEGTQRVKP